MKIREFSTDVVSYNTEYSQNAFGNRSGNRGRKLGVYRCKSCRTEIKMWLDYGRLPVCLTCLKETEWEYLHNNLDDITQPGHL